MCDYESLSPMSLDQTGPDYDLSNCGALVVKIGGGRSCTCYLSFVTNIILLLLF